MCLMLKSLSHLELIFVHRVRVCSNFTDIHAVVQHAQHHLPQRLSFSHFILLPPLSGLSIAFHLFNMSIFVPIQIPH